MNRGLLGTLGFAGILIAINVVSCDGKFIVDPQAFVWTIACLAVGFCAGLVSRGER